MADVHRGAMLNYAAIARERGEQELLKLFRRHAIAFDLQPVFFIPASALHPTCVALLTGFEL